MERLGWFEIRMTSEGLAWCTCEENPRPLAYGWPPGETPVEGRRDLLRYDEQGGALQHRGAARFFVERLSQPLRERFAGEGDDLSVGVLIQAAEAPLDAFQQECRRLEGAFRFRRELGAADHGQSAIGRVHVVWKVAVDFLSGDKAVAAWRGKITEVLAQREALGLFLVAKNGDSLEVWSCEATPRRLELPVDREIAVSAGHEIFHFVEAGGRLEARGKLGAKVSFGVHAAQRILDTPATQARPELVVVVRANKDRAADFQELRQAFSRRGSFVKLAPPDSRSPFRDAFAVSPAPIAFGDPATADRTLSHIAEVELSRAVTALVRPPQARGPVAKWIVVADEAGAARDAFEGNQESDPEPTVMVYVAVPADSKLAHLPRGFHATQDRTKLVPALKALAAEPSARLYAFEWRRGKPTTNVDDPVSRDIHWDLWRHTMPLVIDDLVGRRGAQDIDLYFEQATSLKPDSGTPMVNQRLKEIVDGWVSMPDRSAVRLRGRVIPKDGHRWLGYADAAAMILRAPRRAELAVREAIRGMSIEAPFDMAALIDVANWLALVGHPDRLVASLQRQSSLFIESYRPYLLAPLAGALDALSNDPNALHKLAAGLAQDLRESPASYAAVDLILSSLPLDDPRLVAFFGDYRELHFRFLNCKLVAANHRSDIDGAEAVAARWRALEADGGEPPSEETRDWFEIMYGGTLTNRFDFATAVERARRRWEARRADGAFSVTVLRSSIMQWLALQGDFGEADAVLEAIKGRKEVPQDRTRYFVYKAHICADRGDWPGALAALLEEAGIADLAGAEPKLRMARARSAYWWHAFLKWWAGSGDRREPAIERLAEEPLGIRRNPYDAIYYWGAVGLLERGKRDAAGRLAGEFVAVCEGSIAGDKDVVGVIRACYLADLEVRGLVHAGFPAHYREQVLARSHASTQAWVAALGVAQPAAPGEALGPLHFNFR